MPNRLAQSHSPYLLQHQNNPVDWFPWCDEAFAAAVQLDRPVFLSVGYAACHWCHVMEHESFENAEIAEFLNQHFVCIKVDREERPDIDQVYMNAVQVMSGRGGWPMSVFLNLDRKPFYAGTYWPSTPRHGMPSFLQVLEAVVDAWTARREDVESHADEIRGALVKVSGANATASDVVVDESVLTTATERLLRVFDRRDGGFGGAPKFPHATDIELLLSRGFTCDKPELVQAATFTLDRIAAGGIRDHIGGGLARYSVDGRWLVPHFEKMLYDNALLSLCYTHAFQITGEECYADVARGTLNYLCREMVDPSGGFHCSEDADSEGVEGKYYVWTPAEVVEVLGDEWAELFCRVYDITAEGNFEGHNIPNLLHGVDATPQQRKLLNESLELLRQARDARVRPGRDDKILTSWNSLAIKSLAVAGGVLDEQSFVDAAQRAMEFTFREMFDDQGRLRHAYRAGVSHIDAFVDDYAFTIEALIALFESTGKARWIGKAIQLADQLLARFQDDASGGFYYTAHESETLIARNKDWHDASVVSGNASAATSLLRLSRLCGRDDYRLAAARTLAAGADVMQNQYAACAALLAAFDRSLHDAAQLVLAVPDQVAFLKIRGEFLGGFQPHATRSWVIGKAPTSGPLVVINSGKSPIDAQPTLYRCEDFVCNSPLVGGEARQSLRPR